MVQRLANAFQNKGKAKAYVFALGFCWNAYDEVARVKTKQGIEIELVRIQAAVQQEPPQELP